ncbi:PLDc N-terminal domain-containing protein [Mangrovicoccus algicola]|uniref:PLDc N-terminal domain-containing protein n=1 Tax=Mangrovicoccus algicola TaxID=2771008 RepID=A0A8J6Z8W9_9RHOB|nr:PLDc N-terminal domain-containing protein [Mangrovicoccus algicola]MBE3638420.1 PLDc N-terminal domain-containing protein [Mangrovicoccus algicola]
MELSGLGALILLALDIWAVYNVVLSSASTGRKVLWVLLILILPLIGFLIWIFAGPRRAGGAV